MRGILAGVGILVVLATLCVGEETIGTQETCVEYEDLAARLPYLALSTVLYRRTEHSFEVANKRERDEHFRLLGKAVDRKHSKKALLALLGHGDPKVRTLAAVALFDREDPSILPSLVELCADEAATFDGHPELSATWLRDTGIGPPPKKQTVGDIAKKMVAFYMEPSGFHYGIKHRSEPGFAEYWEARKDRTHCGAWYAVQLVRASQGTYPVRQECIHRIREVRGRIDALPADERTWVLLWLNGNDGSDALVTEEELVEACKKVGPGKLILMLQNKIPSDDPDLQPRKMDNWPRKRMQIFVLRHAEQLLRQSDSDVLLACERWQLDYRKHGISDPTDTPWWAIAAARLAPAKAAEILHDAMKRFQDKYDSDERSKLCVEMWQLCGEGQMEFIANWFYEDSPERGSFPGSRGSFIDAMGKDPRGRKMVARLVQDPRFAGMDWQSLERLVRVVNGWSEKPVVSKSELSSTWHPLGQGHYHWMQSEAETKYPKETADLRERLDDWRKRLRASLPTLLGPEGRTK